MALNPTPWTFKWLLADSFIQKRLTISSSNHDNITQNVENQVKHQVKSFKWNNQRLRVLFCRPTDEFSVEFLLFRQNNQSWFCWAQLGPLIVRERRGWLSGDFAWSCPGSEQHGSSLTHPYRVTPIWGCLGMYVLLSSAVFNWALPVLDLIFRPRYN